MANDTLMEQDKFIVEENLPGYKNEDIKIDINKSTRMLEIVAQKSSETEEEKSEQKGDIKIYFYEKKAESFYKAHAIPEDFDLENVKTTLHKDGTLTIEFVKYE